MSAYAQSGLAGAPAGTRDHGISGAGIGLRLCHIDEVLRQRPPIPWMELLADNHLAEGGLTALHVEALASLYPLTLHCVGMNLAGTDPLDDDYLRRVLALRERSAAAWVSDHLCFTAVGGRRYHELLPFPYTDQSLRHVAARVHRIQEILGAPLVIENVSAYLRFSDSALGEAQFLSALCRDTDCRLLLDVNNVYVNAINHGEDAEAYLRALPFERVAEIHLAGFAPREDYLLDAHDRAVAAPVWDLYARVATRLSGVPTLIEWDNDIPPLPVLLAEADKVAAITEAPR
ncbi:MAG: DUF692 domain-containing protein [Thiohalocapsa sp.]|nr:DUF692 domain-containing protein [Thiohalocapsa sp.]